MEKLAEALPVLVVPFVACLVIASLHCYMGLHVIRRGVIFVDLALAQCAALGAAVALATLDVFEEEQTLLHLPEKIARLGEHLQRIGQLPHLGDVRQCGLIAGIELVRDRATKEPYPWAEKRGIRVCDHARGEGVLLRPLGNVIVIMPPLAITLDELNRIADAVHRGIVATT